MPRTKRRTVKRVSSVEDNMTVNMTVDNQTKNIKQLLEEFDSEKQNIENNFYNAFDQSRNIIENAFLMIKMNLGDTLLKQNLQQYILKNSGVKSTKGSDRLARPVTKSANGGSTRKKSASAGRSKQTSSTATVTKNRSKTQSEERPPLSEKNNETKFKTPMNRPPMPASATVTPKVNMNEPISMMRRPNQGEVALSMTGSPLMVSSVSRDDMATVSVPLANGNVLSILPRAGATMDISFDEQTKHELLLLKGNIEGLLKMNNGI